MENENTTTEVPEQRAETDTADDSGARVFALPLFPMAEPQVFTGQTAEDIVGHIFGTEALDRFKARVKEHMAENFPTGGPVSLNRADLEMIADALMFYHSAHKALIHNGMSSDVDRAHDQYHDTANKVGQILDRMINQDPSLTVNVTPF